MGELLRESVAGLSRQEPPWLSDVTGAAVKDAAGLLKCVCVQNG